MAFPVSVPAAGASVRPSLRRRVSALLSARPARAGSAGPHHGTAMSQRRLRRPREGAQDQEARADRPPAQALRELIAGSTARLLQDAVERARGRRAAAGRRALDPDRQPSRPLGGRRTWPQRTARLRLWNGTARAPPRMRRTQLFRRSARRGSGLEKPRAPQPDVDPTAAASVKKRPSGGTGQYGPWRVSSAARRRRWLGGERSERSERVTAIQPPWNGRPARRRHSPPSAPSALWTRAKKRPLGLIHLPSEIGEKTPALGGQAPPPWAGRRERARRAAPLSDRRGEPPPDRGGPRKLRASGGGAGWAKTVRDPYPAASRGGQAFAISCASGVRSEGK